MRFTSAPRLAQEISPTHALEIARERFPNLCCGGILAKRAVGAPVDLDDIAHALEVLAWCRRSEEPSCHSFDLRRLIGGQLGATITACVALGFDVHSWFGVTSFSPHALIAVNEADVARVAQLGLTI
jgi:hypothetical protein